MAEQIANIIRIGMLVVLGMLVISLLTMGKSVAVADYDTRSTLYQSRLLESADADGRVTLSDFDTEKLLDIMGVQNTNAFSFKVNITTMAGDESHYVAYYGESHYDLAYPLINIRENQYVSEYRYSVRDFADISEAAIIQIHFIYQKNR